jgi:GNAT superfamily N-acetyltransferase
VDSTDESATGSANFWSMEIRAATSPHDLRAFAHVVERVEGLRIGVDEFRYDLEAQPDTRFLLALDGGAVVGSAVGKRSSQAGMLYAMARVLPEARRCGAGSALHGALSAHAASLGLRELWGRVHEPPGFEFVRNRGFWEFGREIESVLNVTTAPGVDPPPGVEITNAALLARPMEPGTAEHQLTGVKRAWRRRGIAAALKRAQIGWAAENGFRRLVTYNDEANLPMRGVNARLGYEPQPPVVLVIGPLAPKAG